MTDHSHDLLARSTPRRLRCRGGDWELELERFDRMSGALYRPKSVAVVGPAAIRDALAALVSSSAFCDAVERAMADPDAEDILFEVAGDSLRRVSEVEERFDSAEATQRLAAAELEIARLRARVARLEQSFGSLRARGAAGPSGGFARSGSSGAGSSGAGSDDPSADKRRSGGSNPDVSSPPQSAGGQSGPADHAPSSGPGTDGAPADVEAAAGQAAPPESMGDSSSSPEPAETPSDEAGEQAAPTPAAVPMAKIPSGADLSRILEGLLGAPVPLTDSEPLNVEATAYGSILVDDEDNVVGALVADLRATVMLGGTLMMIPEGALEEALEAGEPTEDMLEAMSEVLNVSSRAFNDVPGNPHVRTQALAPLDLEAHPWLRNPAERADLAEPNGGTLAMLVRAEDG